MSPLIKSNIMIKEIDIKELDCIFLTYDEPKKEEFWIKIQNIVPWAKRVDGIKGSDSAHKAAADASDTERFILIDGDNIPDKTFLDQTLIINDENKHQVFRWKARNVINGLVYGNGGISCWTKQFVHNMQTHENTDGRSESIIEFCYEKDYRAMHDCYSTTYPNGTPFQAWRAGFREGVKLCLNRGSKPDLNNLESEIHKKNYDNLCIWQSIGRDVENGWWAIYGARLGTYLTLLRHWDYTKVQNFDELKSLWSSFSKDDIDACRSLGDTLRKKINLPIVEMTAEQSKFFKHYYYKHLNKGIMEYDKGYE